jgi:hypothetical protein
MSSFQESKHHHKHKLLSYKITKIRHNKYPYNKLEVFTHLGRGDFACTFTTALQAHALRPDFATMRGDFHLRH